MYRSQLIQEVRDFTALKILDVREDDEYYGEGHIPNASYFPLSSLQESYSRLNRNEEYYVVCYSGSRSQMACQFLDLKGFKVVNLLGGMSQYKGVLE